MGPHLSDFGATGPIATSAYGGFMRIVAADDPSSWVDAAAALDAGSVVALPTDTVYGIATLPEWSGKLFEVKGRDRSVPIAVLVADVDQADRLVALSAADRELAERHWPGALTVVATVRSGVDLDVGGDGATLGVRCPDDGRLRDLLDRVGPLAVTSANLAGEPVLCDASAIGELPGVELVVDGGRLDGPASTVVHDGVVLRAGPVQLG